MSLKCINFKMGFWWTSKKNYITMSTNCYLKFWIPNSKRFYFWENLSFKILLNMLISWPKYTLPIMTFVIYFIYFTSESRFNLNLVSLSNFQLTIKFIFHFLKIWRNAFFVACNEIESSSVIFSERYLTERNRKIMFLVIVVQILLLPFASVLTRITST